jgi:hypothetical protein
MTLQSAVRFVQHREASERLLRAVDDLDETIKIIRSTIFGLRSHGNGPSRRQGLRVRVARLVEEAVGNLGFTPALRMEGLVDTDVPPAVADHVVAVLAEALSNAARHARAAAAEVSLVVAGGSLTATVADDGVGVPQGGRRSGLANLAERAGKLGGELLVERPPSGGSRLVWRVPLSGGWAMAERGRAPVGPGSGAPGGPGEFAGDRVGPPPDAFAVAEVAALALCDELPGDEAACAPVQPAAEGGVAACAEQGGECGGLAGGQDVGGQAALPQGSADPFGDLGGGAVPGAVGDEYVVRGGHR